MFRTRTIAISLASVLAVFLVLRDSLSENPQSDLGAETKTAKPNVVIILADTLRADHLPFYGYEKNTAPFLNQIAQESLVFSRAFSTSSYTPPATASLLTGLYPSQHGVTRGSDRALKLERRDSSTLPIGLPKDVSLLSEIFKQAGYQTFAAINSPHLSRELGFARGFDHFFQLENSKSAKAINDQVLAWKELLQAGEPYFLYLHYLDPHNPYFLRGEDGKNKNPPSSANAKWDREKRIRAYDSEIVYLDRHIQRLFEEFHWQKNTLLIFTADHGEGFGEHGQFLHDRNLFQEVVRVPLLLRYPEGISIARRINRNVSLIDVFPTLLDLLGIHQTANLPGVSLLEPFESEPNEGDDRSLLMNLVAVDSAKKGFAVVNAIVFNDWKYIHDGLLRKEFLFDLKEDSEEMRNRLEMKGGPVDFLKTELERLQNLPRSQKIKAMEFEVKRETTEALRTLGYVD